MCWSSLGSSTLSCRLNPLGSLVGLRTEQGSLLYSNGQVAVQSQGAHSLYPSTFLPQQQRYRVSRSSHICVGQAILSFETPIHRSTSLLVSVNSSSKHIINILFSDNKLVITLLYTSISVNKLGNSIVLYKGRVREWRKSRDRLQKKIIRL